MAEDPKVEGLARLLAEAGRSHHQAFIDTDGDDPEWPLWYAGYLEDRIPAHLGMALTRSKLVQCLLNADDDYNTASPGQPWSEFFARYLLGLNPGQMDVPAEPGVPD